MGAAIAGAGESLSHAARCGNVQVGADTLVQEAGVTPLLHRLCAAPILEAVSLRRHHREQAGREAILANASSMLPAMRDIAARSGSAVSKSPKDEMMGVSVMFSMSGVNKQRFIDAGQADPQTYADWSGNAMGHETTGKKTSCFPVSAQPFKQRWPPGSFHPTCIRSPGPGTVTAGRSHFI